MFVLHFAYQLLHVKIYVCYLRQLGSAGQPWWRTSVCKEENEFVHAAMPHTATPVHHQFCAIVRERCRMLLCCQSPEIYVAPAAHCGKDVFNSQLNRSRICSILSALDIT